MLNQCLLIDPSKITPQEVDEKIGENVKFSCASFTDVKWYFNKTLLLPREFRQIDNNIYIDDISHDNQGYYECNGKTNDNLPFIAKAYLKVRGKQTSSFILQ